jgi:hypothetical protein
MNTTISTKLAALALALVVNSVLMGSVVFAFSAQSAGLPVAAVQSVTTATHSVAV